ncbi:MAG: sulfatase-like hydrolase/transferase [Pseudomonadota bacterium]
MKPKNLLIVLSDEHNRDVLGCYGDDLVRTPNIDAIASRGTVFQNAYCNSPVCVSSRASMASGRYPHQIRAWDSTAPYDGVPHGWARQLRDQGHDVTSIGKLHYRSAEDDCGFDPSLLPMHVHNGVGWLSSLLREPPAPIAAADQMARRVGSGETDYTRYDRNITQAACAWIKDRAKQNQDKPWVLQVGLVAPHFPLIAPSAFYDLYDQTVLPPPRQYAEEERPRHPVLDALRVSSNCDDWFDEETVRIARRSYYSLVSFLDHNVGLLMGALESAGLMEETRVIYTSDHGDNLGHRGLWGKSVMYDDAVAVPLVFAGPDVPDGKRVETPVSLIDLHQTVMNSVGSAMLRDDDISPGECLSNRFDQPSADRAVFSEYHDWSAITGMFMLRTRRWKIVRYPGFGDQLFDMVSDPQETNDLADCPEYRPVLDMMRARLSSVVDVSQTKEDAFKDQRQKIADFGGREAILEGEEFGYTPAPIDMQAGGVPADKHEP